jgi:hypothetical protein
MKKFLLVSCLFIISIHAFPQQFSHYNTGTLYESFENPSVKTFTPDSSRHIAFNFLIPNFDGNFYATGDAQVPLKSRFYLGYYNTSPLQVGHQKYNYVAGNFNAYTIMLKLFTSLEGNVEVGFFTKTTAESRGIFSDESVAIFNGPGKFSNSSTWPNVFNDKGTYQIYHQAGLTYREQVDKQLSIGFKLSLLMGAEYGSLKINSSNIVFDTANNKANLSLAGRYQTGGGPGQFSARDFLPTFRNPGAAVSMGISYITENHITVQANLKDLGFIHWDNKSSTKDFDESGTINNLTGIHREDSIYKTAKRVVNNTTAVIGPFTTAVNGKAEISASKNYYFGDENQFTYAPTLIGSKSVIYTDFSAAMLNKFQIKNYSITVMGSYDNLRLFSAGGQFMIKSPNAEFFIGSERLLQSARYGAAVLGKSSQVNYMGAYTGGDIYLGFSLKFGSIIEHPMNASTIPLGEKGFFGRLYNRLFKTNY